MQIQQGVQTMQVAKNDANEQPPGLESGEITSPSAPTHHPKSFSEANMPQQDIGPPSMSISYYFFVYMYSGAYIFHNSIIYNDFGVGN